MRTVLRATSLILLSVCIFAGGSTAFADAKSRAQSLQEILVRGGFLLDAIDVIDYQLQNHQELAELFEQCPSRRTLDDECQLAVSVLRSLPQVVREARQHLALGYRDRVTQKFSKDVSERIYKVNAELKDLGTIKAASWVALSPSEAAQAQASLGMLIARGGALAAKLHPNDAAKSENFIRLYVHRERREHLQAYSLILSQLPILQYLTRATLPSGDVRAALATIKENLAAERKLNRQRRTILNRWLAGAGTCADDVELAKDPMIAAFSQAGLPACINVPSKLFALLDYTSVVKGLAAASPRAKKALSDLQFERTARLLTTFAIVMPVTIVVFVVAPPLIAVGLGVAGTAHAIHSANRDVKRAERQEFVRVLDPGGEADVSNVKFARHNRIATYVVAPLVFGGLAGSGVRKLSPVALAAIKSTRFKMAL
ncbi:MAG: hypothetical protein AAB250_12340 [Bdellovibrionota bacterium]